MNTPEQNKAVQANDAESIPLFRLPTWTANNLATYLQVPVSWVYDNYRELFPYFKVGNKVRFKPETIRLVLDEVYRHDPIDDSDWRHKE